MSYPVGINSRTVTGQYAELYFDRTDNQYKARPKLGFVMVYPGAKSIRVDSTGVILDLSSLYPQRVEVAPDGTFSFDAIITDQPGITPNNGWTYRVVPSWGERVASIPVSAGSGPIDLNDYFGAAEVPGFVITKGDTGRGIVEITTQGLVATVHYDDGTTNTFALPVGDGSEGGIPDATTDVKGKILLAGDLTGTANAPVIGADKITSAKLHPDVRTTLGKAETAVQPAGLTKAAVGLGNVDNTADVNKPVSSATQTALNLKVNITSLHAVATSGSYNDLTSKPTIPSTKADIGLGNVDNTSDLSKPISTATASALTGKANVSHTHPEYIKTVNGVSPDGSGAVTVGVDWSAITSIPSTFTPSAHTHAYNTLTGIPSTFTPSSHTHVEADVTGLTAALAGKSNTGHTHLWADITDKPTTFTPATHTHTVSQLSDSTTIGRTVITAADAAAVRTAIGAGVSNLAIGSTGSTAAAGNHVHDYATLTNTPTTFTPSAHVHTIANITGLQTAIDGKAALSHTHNTNEINGLDVALSNKANVSALATKADLVAGVIPTSQLPKRSLITSVAVADQAAMLALTVDQVQPGDVAVRLDIQSSFMLQEDDPSDINNWQKLSWAPGTGGSTTVQTVNGQVGDVIIGKADVGLGNVNNVADLDKPISTLTQAALDAKAPLSHTHTAANISDSTTVGRSLIVATDAAAARSAIGAGTGSSNLVIGTTSTTAKAGDYVPAWSEITSKPSTFAPSAHTHATSEITNLDTALAAKAPLASPAFTGTVTGITKAMVGLGSVDNTADSAKPVSSAQQTALDGKSDTGHTHAYSSLTGIPSTFAPSSHSHVTADVTGLDTALGDKAPLASPTFTGTPAAPTATGGTNTTQIATTAFVTTAVSTKANTSHTHLWADITDKPTTFAPSTHSHAQSDVTGLTAALAAKEPTIAGGTTSQYLRGDKTFVSIDKTTVGLGNVDNTSDTTKFTNTPLTGTPTAPTAAGGTNTTQIATTAFVTAGLAGKANSSHTHAQSDITNLTTDLAAKAPLASPAFTGTPTGITKGHVGLGNVDNTSDATKFTSPTFTGVPVAPTATAGTNTTQVATTAFVTTGLAGKSDTGHVHAYSSLTGIPSTFTPSAHSHVTSDVTGLDTALAGKVANASGQTITLWKGTQAQYDAIGSKDANTLYAITA